MSSTQSQSGSDLPAATGMYDSKRVTSTALGILLLVYFFSSIDRSIFNILAQPIKEELLLADWQLGFLTGFAFSAVHLIFGLVMANLSDRKNRVNILALCVAFWSVMTGLSGLCASFVQLSLARMGVGVGEAGCIPASHSLISDYFPRGRRTKALAIYGLGYPLGGLFGTIIGGVALDHWGWRAAFLVVGLPGILVALLTWRAVKEPQRGRYDDREGDTQGHTAPRSYRQVWLTMWNSPVLRQMMIALVLLTFFTSPTGSFLGPFLIRKFPISYTQLGFIVATTMMLGASISTYFGGVIAQRLGQDNQRWLLWFPAVTTLAGMPFYVAALAQTDWQSLSVLLFFGALLNATFLAPCFTVAYNSIAPGGRAKAAVLLQILIVLIGQSCGPLFAGAANDVVASFIFKAGGNFLNLCPGGQALAGAGAALDKACRDAMMRATEIVLITTMALTAWPCWHFYLAGRRMRPVGSAADDRHG